MFFNMSLIKFENEVVDFLLSPPSQDAFKASKLQDLLYNVRHEVAQDQIEDVMEIILKCHDELSLFLNWKKHIVKKKKSVIERCVVRVMHSFEVF